MPYYPPGGDRSGTGEWDRVQKPLAPETSAKHLLTPAAFEAKLFASEPEIVNPIAMAWDPRGRLWIAETVDYPNDKQPGGKGDDRIRICEDTDGDGRADTFTVFADGLSIPTSLTFARGGVIVHQPPKTLFLKDTDGDDRADVRETLFKGWSTGDTHAGPSNLRYGFDNWIWGTVGYAGFKGKVGGEKMKFRSAVYRFRPDGSELEVIRSTRGNTWGLGFNEAGMVFCSMATSNNPSAYVAIPDRAVERVRGWERKPVRGIEESPRFLPVTDRVRQVDRHGNFTAAAGHQIYTARTYPKRYWNRTAFVGGPTGHLLGTFQLVNDGAGYRSTNTHNLAASDDAWTSPIQAKVGPDGQVWMIDWYNYIVQHNPTPKGYETGKGNAYEIDLRDKSHGRIYRIVYEDAEPAERPSLADASADRLVQALSHPNLLWRRHAQRLLVERGKTDVVPALLERVRDETVDEVGLAPGAVHALWTLHGLGAVKAANDKVMAAVEAALTHPSAAVRINALRVLPPTGATTERILSAGALNDDEPRVRMAALLALSRTPPSRNAGAAVFGMLAERRNWNDRWIADAATAAGATHHGGFLSVAERVRTAAASGEADGANLLPNASFEKRSDGGPAGWAVRNYTGEADHAHVRGVSHSGERSLRIRSDSGADTSWHTDVEVDPQTRYRLSAWIKTKGIEAVKGGMGALLNVHGMGKTTTDVVRGTKGWTRVTVRFNSRKREKISINCLYGGWGQATGTAWYDDVEVVPLGPAPAGLGRVVRRVKRHARSGDGERVADRKGFGELSRLTGGDPEEGKKIFFQNRTASCVRCHTIDGRGGEIGPDLSDIAARREKSYIVESLMKPNAELSKRYDGRVSPMPPIGSLLEPEQIRDLVAYLSNRE